jgi:predicted  nucleic acid-binding Zn-ribbon protein
MSGSKKRTLCRVMAYVVSLFFPKKACTMTADTYHTFIMMVCDKNHYLKSIQKPVETAEKYEKDLGKEDSNMHIIFPNIYVTQTQAATMALAVAAKLKNILPDLEEKMGKDWGDAIDAQPYLTSQSLRMLGSRKSSRCTKCGHLKNKLKEGCNECGDQRYLDKGGVYKLRWVLREKDLDDGKNPEKSHPAFQSTFNMLRYCSIRNPSNRSACPAGWEPFKHCPIYQPRPEKTAAVETMREAGGKAKTKNNRHVIPRTTTWRALEQTVRNVDNVYSKVYIASAEMHPRNYYYKVYVAGVGSRVCLNLKPPSREHKSRGIYFIVKPSGVIQKCDCQCSTENDRHHGACKNYQSISVRLSETDRCALFAEKNTKPTVLPIVGVKRPSGTDLFDSILLNTKRLAYGRSADSIYSNTCTQTELVRLKKKQQQTQQKKRPPSL